MLALAVASDYHNASDVPLTSLPLNPCIHAQKALFKFEKVAQNQTHRA